MKAGQASAEKQTTIVGMIYMKRVLAVILVIALVLGLAACGKGGTNTENTGNTGTDDNTNNNNNAEPDNTVPSDPNAVGGVYRIIIRCPEEAADLIIKQIADFNAGNGHGIAIQASIEGRSEEQPAAQAEETEPAVPDLVIFTQDQLAGMVQSGSLEALSEADSKIVRDSCDAEAVMAATDGDQLYAYPLTAFSSSVLYYDKRSIPEADVVSLEKLIADCEIANKYICIETDTSAKYIPSFFLAAGCVSEWQTGAGGSFTGVNDTFNSPEGLAAAKGLYKVQRSFFHRSSDLTADFSSGSAVVVSGLDAYKEARRILGDDLGIAALPSFSVNDREYRMGSLKSCLLLGITPQTDAKISSILVQLAQFLIEYDRQFERFNALGWYPSNLKAQSSDAVRSNAAAAAVREQNNNASIQGPVHSEWQKIALALAAEIKAGDGSDAALQRALGNYRTAIDRLFGTDGGGLE